MQILIVALLPDKITNELLDLSSKYQPKLFGSKELPPHFTLVPPIRLKFDLPTVQLTLQKTINQIKSFPILIDGIKTFRKRKNVIFYNIVASTDLSNLHRQINRCLSDLVDQRFLRQLPFKPHITFAKKMSNGELQKILLDLKDFQPKYQFNLKKIGLFTMTDRERFWSLKKIFDLKS